MHPKLNSLFGLSHINAILSFFLNGRLWILPVLSRVVPPNKAEEVPAIDTSLLPLLLIPPFGACRCNVSPGNQLTVRDKDYLIRFVGWRKLQDFLRVRDENTSSSEQKKSFKDYIWRAIKL